MLKFGLSLLVIVFDVLFILQHYLFYRDRSDNIYGKVGERTGHGRAGSSRMSQARAPPPFLPSPILPSRLFLPFFISRPPCLSLSRPCLFLTFLTILTFLAFLVVRTLVPSATDQGQPDSGAAAVDQRRRLGRGGQRVQQARAQALPGLLRRGLPVPRKVRSVLVIAHVRPALGCCAPESVVVCLVIVFSVHVEWSGLDNRWWGLLCGSVA